MAVIVVTGRLGGDARILTATASGQNFVAFTLADRLNKDQTDWYNVTYNISPNSMLPQYLKKGAVVEVVGRPQINGPYQKHDGQYGADIKIFANSLKLIQTNDNKEDQGQPNPASPW